MPKAKHKGVNFVGTNDIVKFRSRRVSIRHGAKIVYYNIDSGIATRIVRQTPEYRIESAIKAA